MKRQDVNGVERLAVEGGSSAGATVDLVAINGVAPSVNNGTADAGTLRVAIASDSPPNAAFGAAFPAIGVAAGFIGSTGNLTGGSLDAAGFLKVNVAAGSGGNSAASATGAAVPSDADYTGLNVGGTLRGATGVNPAGSVFAQQVDIASVNGVAGATVPVSGTVSATVSGTVTANQGTSPWIVVGGGTAGTAATGVVTVQGIASMTPVQVSQATASNLNATVVQGTGTNLHVVTDATSTTIATQATGTNLHTVVDSGAVTATIGAGTALIGRTSSSDETSTIYNATTALTPKFVAVAASSNGNNTVVAAVALKKIRVIGYNLFSSGTVNAKWQSAASGTDLTGLKYFVANTGISVSYNPVGWFETVAGELLNLNLSAGVAVGGELVYLEV